MVGLVVWSFFALVQVKGMTGGVFTTPDACEETRKEVAGYSDTLAISDACVEIKIAPVDRTPKEKAAQ